MKSTQKQIIGIIIVSILITLGLYGYFAYRAKYPQTDDAYLHAHVIPITAQAGGKVAKIYVEDNQFVDQNQPFFTIDKRSYELSVKEAEAELALARQQINVDIGAIEIVKARLKRAQAEFANKKKIFQRVMTLVKSGQESKARGDQVIAEYESAQASENAIIKELTQAQARLGEQDDANARVRQAQVRLDRALLNLSYTNVKAPAAGYTTKFKLRTGATVKIGQPLFYFVEDGCWWIEANYKETQMKHIKPGQMAEIELDMYPGTKLKGYVESISRGSGAFFSLLPPENATGNWVKVTQRFPIRIVLLNVPKTIVPRVGASANVVIDTKTITKQRNSACKLSPKL